MEKINNPKVEAFFASAEKVYHEHYRLLEKAREEMMVWAMIKDGNIDLLKRQSIDVLGLPLRAYSSLVTNGYTRIWQVCQKSEKEILALDGMGRGSVLAIRQALLEFGLGLSPNKRKTKP